MPVLIHVPHAATRLAPGLDARLSKAARALPDTDWHVEKLAAAIAPQAGIEVLCASWSRYVIDLNRGADDQPLYRGPTTGLVPTETFSGRAVYRHRDPDEAEIAARIEDYWRPHHARLNARIDALRARHGIAVVVDLHSIRSRVPRLFEGRLPDLNLGTFDGRSCAPALARAAADVLAGQDDFTHVVDGRFKGGYITRHYGRPHAGVHALQLEIAQACYMDESCPAHWDAQRAEPLVQVLRKLVATVAQWAGQ